MTCPLCCTRPAALAWHGVPICLPCREAERDADRRLTWTILVFLGIAILLALLST